jgi:adenine-specific DNA-methyltransferase
MNEKLNSIRHRDKRANIPTNDLRGFMEEEEKAPKTMRYPRDPSLDPQLVWKGKDEQDGEDLAVPAVPVYIQEKIHPQAIIEAFRAEVRRQCRRRPTCSRTSTAFPSPIRSSSTGTSRTGRTG